MSGKPHLEVRPWSIGPQQEVAIRANSETFDWLCRQSGEFFRPYIGKWIAAKQCCIIAVGDTLDEVLVQLEETDRHTVLLHQVRHPGKVIYRCNLQNPG
jgi:hypothetical protein